MKLRVIENPQRWKKYSLTKELELGDYLEIEATYGGPGDNDNFYFNLIDGDNNWLFHCSVRQSIWTTGKSSLLIKKLEWNILGAMAILLLEFEKYKSTKRAMRQNCKILLVRTSIIEDHKMRSSHEKHVYISVFNSHIRWWGSETRVEFPSLTRNGDFVIRIVVMDNGYEVRFNGKALTKTFHYVKPFSTVKSVYLSGGGNNGFKWNKIILPGDEKDGK